MKHIESMLLIKDWTKVTPEASIWLELLWTVVFLIPALIILVRFRRNHHMTTFREIIRLVSMSSLVNASVQVGFLVAAEQVGEYTSKGLSIFAAILWIAAALGYIWSNQGTDPTQPKEADWTPEPIVGFRTTIEPMGAGSKFRYHRDGEARCAVGGKHIAPEWNCTCGYYAYKEPIRGTYYVVLLWGNVVEHERGYRAQYMRPISNAHIAHTSEGTPIVNHFYAMEVEKAKQQLQEDIGGNR